MHNFSLFLRPFSNSQSCASLRATHRYALPFAPVRSKVRSPGEVKLKSSFVMTLTARLEFISRQARHCHFTLSSHPISRHCGVSILLRRTPGLAQLHHLARVMLLNHGRSGVLSWVSLAPSHILISTHHAPWNWRAIEDLLISFTWQPLEGKVCMFPAMAPAHVSHVISLLCSKNFSLEKR